MLWLWDSEIPGLGELRVVPRPLVIVFRWKPGTVCWSVFWTSIDKELAVLGWGFYAFCVVISFRNSTVSSWLHGKNCLYPAWAVCYKSLLLFSSEGFKGVKLAVTPQESACLILVLSCLLPSHTVLLRSVFMIRTHLWLRGVWVGWRNFCLHSAFCHVRRVKHVCSRLRKGVILHFLSLYLLSLPRTISSPHYRSACLFSHLSSKSWCTLHICVFCFPFLSCA